MQVPSCSKSVHNSIRKRKVTYKKSGSIDELFLDRKLYRPSYICVPVHVFQIS